MNLAKGTRVRMTKPLQEGDKVGEIYTVERSNESVVVLTRSREYEVDDFMGSGFGVGICGYGVTSQEFSEHFEVIGMEEPKKNKKNAKSEALIGDYTETELDDLWCLAGSYEDFKAMLKLGTKWHPSKQPKKQREWTDWKRWGEDQWYEYSVSRPDGQSAKVKVRTPDGFIGTASCNPSDDFDLAYGVELASIRAEIKNTKNDAEIAFRDYLIEKRCVEDLKKRLEKVLSRAYGKAAK